MDGRAGETSWNGIGIRVEKAVRRGLNGALRWVCFLGFGLLCVCVLCMCVRLISRENPFTGRLNPCMYLESQIPAVKQKKKTPPCEC